jgi:hypothetical protein
MKIPFAGEPGAGAITSRTIDAEKAATAAQPVSTQSATPADSPAETPAAQPGSTQAAPATSGSSVAQVSELLVKLNPQQKKQIADELRTELNVNEGTLKEKWSQKYKDSINCSNPKGFSQKAHCQGKKK